MARGKQTTSRGRGGEFALIDAFLAPFRLQRDGRRGPAGSGVLRGPGDDCAALLPSRGQTLVATTDALVEGVHFDLSLSRARDAGHKALAVNLSDLAAAGARPRWFLCALGVPRVQPSLERVVFATARELGRGMALLAQKSGIALAGGNLAASPGWSLTLTALGEAKAPLSRRGARPGDALVVAGFLGEAALGLRLLRAARKSARQGGQAQAEGGAAAAGAELLQLPRAARLAAMRAQVRPQPLVRAGLAAAPHAAAAIDVSDGLAADLGHLLRASGCGAEIDCAQLPRSAAVRAAEAALARRGEHPYALSLAGGEDYALVFAVRPAKLPRLLSALRALRLPARAVGFCTAGATLVLREGAAAIALPSQAGFDHLAPAPR